MIPPSKVSTTRCRDRSRSHYPADHLTAEFDISVSRGQPAEFPPRRVIKEDPRRSSVCHVKSAVLYPAALSRRYTPTRLARLP